MPIGSSVRPYPTAKQRKCPLTPDFLTLSGFRFRHGRLACGWLAKFRIGTQESESCWQPELPVLPAAEW